MDSPSTPICLTPKKETFYSKICYTFTKKPTPIQTFSYTCPNETNSLPYKERISYNYREKNNLLNKKFLILRQKK